MEPYKKYSRDEVGQLVARYYRSETDGAEVHALARGLQIKPIIDLPRCTAQNPANQKRPTR